MGSQTGVEMKGPLLMQQQQQNTSLTSKNNGEDVSLRSRFYLCLFPKRLLQSYTAHLDHYKNRELDMLWPYQKYCNNRINEDKLLFPM